VNFSELHLSARSGDKAAESQLFAVLSERFRAFAHHRVWNEDDAEELVQESLAVIAQEYRQLEVKTSFQAWAYKVLDNRILAYIKRRKSGRLSSDEFVDQVQAADGDHDLRRKLLVCLRKVITANQRYGRMLNFGYQGFTVGEICERLQISRNNAYVILSRARSLLELCLQTGRIES
jgi:RNA polymerase sigma factor (sigma-70 family)